ncbi:MAG TPA: hypothetical protein VFV96_00685 [Verrucomicrobiae bacterium]|nr:hypothetical protein [Verrucomicrobiae bacterium]
MKLKLIVKSEAGMTLAEVVFSVAILAVCMGGLMGALANGFFTIQTARENQRATQILSQRTEMIRLCNWDNLATFNPDFTEQYDPQSSSSGVVYTGKVTIASVPFTASYSTNMRMMTVTLNWTSKGISHTRSASTFVAKDGMQNYLQPYVY